MLLQALAHPVAELIHRPGILGHADHRNLELASPGHALERREDLFVSQISGGSEKDQGVGRLEAVHRMNLGHSGAAVNGCATRAADSDLVDLLPFDPSRR
jgi:hypothetical protein